MGKEEGRGNVASPLNSSASYYLRILAVLLTEATREFISLLLTSLETTECTDCKAAQQMLALLNLLSCVGHCPRHSTSRFLLIYFVYSTMLLLNILWMFCKQKMPVLFICLFIHLLWNHLQGTFVVTFVVITFYSLPCAWVFQERLRMCVNILVCFQATDALRQFIKCESAILRKCQNLAIPCCCWPVLLKPSIILYNVKVRKIGLNGNL